MMRIHKATSGTAVGANGSATANETTPEPLSGHLVGVAVMYRDSPPGATTDVTIVAVAENGAPEQAILTLTDQATNIVRQPRAQAHTVTGTALATAGSEEIFVPIALMGQRIKVTIAGANAGDSADVLLLVEE